MADGRLVKNGGELEELCSRLSYRVDELAEELEVSRATVFNWKKDERGLPRLVSLALYALETEPRLRKVRGGERGRKQYRRSTEKL